MSYCFVKIDKKTISAEESDLISTEAFSQFECEGKYFFDIDEAKVDEILGKRAYSGGDIPDEVIAEVEEISEEDEQYLSLYFTRSSIIDFSKFLNDKFPKCSFQIKDIEDQDWNEDWKKAYDTIEVEKDLNIVPQWKKFEDSADEIYIYPGMGFGTGSHETTFLCLKAFHQYGMFKENKEVLDFGCGSGILGIAVIKKLKARVDFVDVDVNALDNCAQNLELNEYEKYSLGHALYKRERIEISKYNLIFANILENILLEEKDFLINAVADEGVLILSGLLLDQSENMIKVYSESLTFIESFKKGDWCCLVFKKI